MNEKISEILDGFKIFDGIYKRELIDSAIELKEAGLRAQYPTYSEKEIKEKLRNILLNARS